MASSTFLQVFSNVRRAVNDLGTTGNQRYTDAVLFGYALDGLREMAIYRPDLFAVVGTMNCIAGPEQDVATGLPSALFLIEVLGIVSGADITEMDYESLRLFAPGWRTATPAAAEEWARYPYDDNKQPNTKFFINPPAIVGQQLRTIVAALDVSTLTTASVVPLPTEYEPALQAYVIFRCEAEDDEHINSGRAQLGRNWFEGNLKIGAATEAEKP